jgi:branched-chain amino acid transport system substrate-binding protein
MTLFRFSTLGVLGLMIGSVLVSACVPAASSPTAKAPAATSAPAAGAAPTSAPAQPAAPANGAAATGQATGEPIKIGLLLTNVGASAIFARYEERAARMYVDQTNKSGGINGRALELVYYDTEGKPDRAASIFRRLAEEDKVVAVIGPDSILVVQGMSAVPREVGVLSVTATGSVDIIPEADREWLVTAWAPLGWVNNSATAYFKHKYNIQNIGLLITADTVGEASAKLFNDFAPLAGATVIKTAAQPAADRDLLPSLRDIAGAKPGAAFVIGSGPFGTIAFSQAELAGLTGPIGYAGGNVVPELIKDMGPEATKNFHMVTARLTAVDTLPASDPYAADLKKFAQEYQTANNEPAALPTGVGYDMARTVVDAIKAVGPDRTKIRDYVLGQQSFVGVQGTKFQRTPGNIWGVDPSDMIVVGIENGKFVFKDYLKPSFDALDITPEKITAQLRSARIITK